LHDDPGTSLAYPSAWNYCYRAHPPVSVSVSHQVVACLSRKHEDCPVYLAEREGALPFGLRGSSTVPARNAHRKPNRAIWIILLAALLLAGWWWGRPFFPWSAQPASTPALVVVSKNVPSLTATVRVAWTNPALIITVKARTSTPRASQTLEGTVSPSPATSTLTRTSVPSRTPTATRTPTASRTPTIPSTLPPGTCGHDLDEQFGTGVKFVIHRVTSGDNLDKFAVNYETSGEAILAVNFSMPVPIWAEWIIVIPVGTTDMRGIPPFEPYHATGETISLDKLALQLNTDALSLRKYNAFDDTCTTFVNWLLVPRVRRDE
jgi:hypothetical protein